jgi:hypothetical protein
MLIKNYREINKGCLKSAFTICVPEWGGLEVDCAFFEKEGGNYWVNYAAKEYTKEGKTKSYNMARWPQETTKRLNTAIRDKIKKGEVERKVSDDSYSNENLPF